MKKNIIVTFFLLFVNTIFSYSQVKDYYFYSERQIEDNKKKGSHENYGVIEINDNERFFVIGNGHNYFESIDINAISAGKIYYRGNIVICYDKKLRRRYVFKHINKYTIKAMNHTALFRKGTKFYLSKMENEEESYTAYLYEKDLINSLYWKNGIKNGIHCFYNKTQTKLLYYLNGFAIDSIVAKDRFEPEIDSFIKKYH